MTFVYLASQNKPPTACHTLCNMQPAACYTKFDMQPTFLHYSKRHDVIKFNTYICIKTVREAGRLMGIVGLEPVTHPMDEVV